MGSVSMERNAVSANRMLGVGIALLILVSCSQAGAIGERFILREGETARVRGTELTIEVEQVIDGLDGS
jgi:hypothetical protein